RLQNNQPLLPAVDRALKLGLVHLRPAPDVHALGLVVQLLLRAAPLASGAGAEPAPSAGGNVLARSARRLSRLAATRALLVDRSRSDLLRALGRAALLLLALLDVLVLSFPLVAPGLLRHADPSSVDSRRTCPRSGFLVPIRAAGSGRCARWRTRQ